jgi:hypothetical protein
LLLLIQPDSIVSASANADSTFIIAYT